ncbi:hypothetical protein BDZ91DRAFT_656721 [Kalaharituber pfeilii]|nr:hypothetical protein BDZ91DRAFT_656721 [Kalaharituber pfeilii]
MSDDIEGLVRGICIFYAVGMVLGIARIGIRTYIQRRPGIEEILMGVAMIFWTGDSMLSIVILRNGTNQMTPEERASITPEEQKRREIGSKALLTAWFCYITFIWGAKTCLLLFYRRLMQRVKQIKVIKLAAILLVVTYAAVVLNMFLVCRPFKKNWQVVPDPGHKCTDGYEYVWVIGIFNIVTDAVLIAIPLPVVVGLRISRAKKAMLVLLFGSGVFVIVATTLRIYFTIGGDIANLTFWCMIGRPAIFPVLCPIS